MFYIKNIAQKLRNVNDKKLKDYGLNSSQGILLGLINILLDQGKEVNRKLLQETSKLRGSSVTNLLNGLEDKDFIIRKSGLTDERTIWIELTTKGEDLMNDMYGVFENTQEKLLQGMSQAEKEMFKSLLIRAYKNIEE